MKKEGLNLGLLSVLIAVVTLVIIIACALSLGEIMALGYCCRRWLTIRESDSPPAAPHLHMTYHPLYLTCI